MNVIKISFIVVALLSLAILCSADEEDRYFKITEKLAREYVENVKSDKHHNVLKQRDAVPDKETAIGLALVVWESIYGKDQIKEQSPYQAIRVDEYWYVTGSLQKGWLGGTAEAVIRGHDGSFLNVSHGK